MYLKRFVQSLYPVNNVGRVPNTGDFYAIKHIC